ncbi:hypothetical protein Belba_2413 [Belliella baltica DSM 15883]|uniref:Sulfate ABC transporter permease n=1 Tax=Belliella baltica (strain DSM 15883 / CIP 108006 / LMG 21964 / BA134) TaxID=866536 RepID=I3Z6V4_BELBD|nr:hypothetical protein [Belliella baltica]AFL84972.1 hypothetical protein Belba_2413 [Belliella baltica DSM 15883]
MAKPTSPLAQRIEDLINFDKRLFFVIIVLLYISIRFVTNDIILESIPGYEKLAQDGSLTFFFIFNALDYIWTPFALLWKFTLTSFTIWTGVFILGHKISFRSMWKFALVAEIVFILPELIKLLIYISPAESVSAQEIKDFYPLSLLNVVDTSDLHRKFFYPLKTINIFEAIYCWFLTLGIHIYSKRDLKKSFTMVLFGYVVPLIAWLVFYMLVYK